MADRDYTPYQRKIIRRYYEHHGAIQVRRLSELASELYLAEGKQRERLWKQVEGILTRLEFPAVRLAHVMAKRDPALLPGIVQELEQGS